MASRNWEIVACGSSFTLKELESEQLMHSLIGPWEEACSIYVGQSELERRTLVSELPLVIYDVGLGIAANSLAAIEALAEKSVQIVSFEKSPEALRCALESAEKFPFLAGFRAKFPHVFVELLDSGHWNSPDGRVHWRLISGDFRATDLSGLPPADLIYFDFYSPTICPELWSVEVFSKVVRGIGKDGLLITYSSTKAVRVAMLLAGFFVGKGASTDMKQETTVATLNLSLLRQPLDLTWLKSLERAGKPLPEKWKTLYSHPQFSKPES